jgi:hypothetical protein
VQPVTPERRLEEQYLAVLRDLCAATEEATSGLTANSLPGLREATSRQETLAARMQEMLNGSALRGALALPPVAGGTDTLAAEIHAMQRKLAALNRRHAALLSRVRRSVELSLAVCRSCGGNFEGSSQAELYRTWSCEV